MSRILRIGDQGPDVRAVQDVLNFQIRRLKPLEVDGKFGSQTKARVIEFQRVNQLQPDGAVGPFTQEKLFQNETLPISLAIIPTLLLNLPKIGQFRPGTRLPNLIPPLVMPSQPRLTPFQLLPSSFSLIPALNSQGQILNMMLTVPVRNDPADPALRSYQQIVQLLETLPSNFPFRAKIIGAVPNPIKKIGDIDFGFKWGLDPIFDLKKVASPTEFTIGAKANASYTMKVIDQPGSGGLKLGIFAKGDFKGEIDYTSQKATSKPLLNVQGSILVGVEGRF